MKLDHCKRQECKRIVDSLNNALTTTSQANANLSAKVEHLQGLCDTFQKVIKQADEDIQTLHSKGHRLALELECLLMDTKDTAIQSKWWDSAMEAIEEWRK